MSAGTGRYLLQSLVYESQVSFLSSLHEKKIELMSFHTSFILCIWRTVICAVRNPSKTLVTKLYRNEVHLTSSTPDLKRNQTTTSQRSSLTVQLSSLQYLVLMTRTSHYYADNCHIHAMWHHCLICDRATAMATINTQLGEIKVVIKNDW